MSVWYRKKNCWEYWKCGREVGGTKSNVDGVCPAAIETTSDGINDGQNGGRMCWAIAGTFGREMPECLIAKKIGTCLQCEFYFRVIEQERSGFRMAPKRTRLDDGIAETKEP
jgi:hypothetical protein